MRLEQLTTSAFTIPTERYEFGWDLRLGRDDSGLVVAEIQANGERGLGYTYEAPAVAGVIREQLAPVVHGRDLTRFRRRGDAIVRALRNAGRVGLASHALSAVDVALWI